MTFGAIRDPTQAREHVQAILRSKRFHPDDGPRPLKGFVTWLGDLLAPLGRAIAALWRNTFGLLPLFFGQLLAVAVLVALVAYFARLVQRRHIRHATSADKLPVGGTAFEDAGVLEHEATQAEHDGNYKLAVRLRFRAGILRLQHDATAIAPRPGITTREVRDALHSDQFDDLADTFESIAYANAPAYLEDASVAQKTWPTVVAEARGDH